MERIRKVNKRTDTPYLNFYDLEVTHKGGEESHYYMASRTRQERNMTLHTGKVHADGVAIYALYGEKKDKVVMIRQYRYPLGDYVSPQVWWNPMRISMKQPSVSCTKKQVSS